jgi:hypothetical protein
VAIGTSAEGSPPFGVDIHFITAPWVAPTAIHIEAFQASLPQFLKHRRIEYNSTTHLYNISFITSVVGGEETTAC